MRPALEKIKAVLADQELPLTVQDVRKLVEECERKTLTQKAVETLDRLLTDPERLKKLWEEIEMGECPTCKGKDPDCSYEPERPAEKAREWWIYQGTNCTQLLGAPIVAWDPKLPDYIHVVEYSALERAERVIATLEAALQQIKPLPKDFKEFGGIHAIEWRQAAASLAEAALTRAAKLREGK